MLAGKVKSTSHFLWS